MHGSGRKADAWLAQAGSVKTCDLVAEIARRINASHAGSGASVLASDDVLLDRLRDIAREMPKRFSQEDLRRRFDAEMDAYISHMAPGDKSGWQAAASDPYDVLPGGNRVDLADIHKFLRGLMKDLDAQVHEDFRKHE